MWTILDEQHTFQSVPMFALNATDREKEEVLASTECFLQNLAFCQDSIFGLGINFCCRTQTSICSVIIKIQIVVSTTLKLFKCLLVHIPLRYVWHYVFNLRQKWTNCSYSRPQFLTVQQNNKEIKLPPVYRRDTVPRTKNSTCASWKYSGRFPLQPLKKKKKKKERNKTQCMSENKYACCSLELFPSQQSEHLPGIYTNQIQVPIKPSQDLSTES